MDQREPSQADALLMQMTAQVEPAQRERMGVLLTQYFRQAAPDDLAERSVEAWLAAVQSHAQWAQVRAVGCAQVRVLNSTSVPHERAPRRTVIEIVNDDMPFLVDSTVMEINRQGLMLHLILHPVLWVERDAQGELVRVLDAADPREHATRESWIRIEVDHLIDAQQRAELIHGIESVLADVRTAVQDWRPMQARLREALDEFATAPAGIASGEGSELQETRAFLQWLLDNHFVLLGYRQHELVLEQGLDALKLVSDSGLGVLRATDQEQRNGSVALLPTRARALARAVSPLVVVTKANTRSTVHRPGYTDYIGIKRFNAQGQVVGEHRFVGLFTSTAYSARALDVPLVRGKVHSVMQRAATQGIATGGHLGKALAHILETFPRDELFQITPDMLHTIARGILQLGERQRLRLFLRHDPFDRYVSCLVFVPREVYSTELRRRFVHILSAAFNGSTTDYNVLLTDDVLARIHITVRTTAGQIPAYDRKALENELATVARRWDDELRDALIEAEGEAHGAFLARRWAAAFPAAYRERVPARAAVADVQKAHALSAEQPLGLALYRGQDGELGFKVYHLGSPVVLSDSLPMLERMGVRVLSENPYRIGTADTAPSNQIWLHDFELQATLSDDAPFDATAQRFEEAFARVFTGRIENDDFNRLVLRAGLSADEIVVLRAYAKYLRQTGFALSQSTIEATLAAHPAVARMLVALFVLRFDPHHASEVAARKQVESIEQALEQVSVLSEDRVLRQMLALMRATLRTNYWRTGVGHSGAPGERRSFLSFKLDSAQVPGLPEPRPLYEIFVYSPRFEGIHLRGGNVARGGLRWSDRPEDFRTEVLGLVKAQMVKNTVIVPVGSKGGFVLKKAPPTAQRDAYLKEGIACYQDYLRGLLDLTDNRVAGQVVPPPHIVRHDGDDPYLVVAADKGTAAFSDYANAVSAEYGHWLGDAFASGGSAGYDHKAMGITARGAWESVKRHFREMGINTQTTDFTVVGIGDMSGDVFGNGMLLSPHIRLVAAFDHRHIFIDPNPDAAASHAERLRLFKLPRSSWADYNAALISQGGGVWARSEKSIFLSPQARAALGIEVEKLTPAELVSAILKAPADLLYNGGIGTYIKSSTETHAEVGDRANDAVRINGGELRAKVVVEGGNLGCTQRGRIEAAQHGVRINTDAIDNSAGVDTSDHEVNIKILLSLAMAESALAPEQRNGLLADMTDAVAALVLRDNVFQAQALSIMRRQGARLIDPQARFIRHLELLGRLNRAIEYLPAEDELVARKAKNQGLVTPELAVLLAYSKMWLYDQVLDSGIPEDPWIGSALTRYFPERLQRELGAWIPRHPLAREIISTHVVNSMVNRVGSTFVHQVCEVSSTSAANVVRAYLLTREIFGYVPLWQAIEALDNQVSDEVQAQMLLQLAGLTFQATAWFARSRRLAEPMQITFGRFRPAVEALNAQLDRSPERADPVAHAWIQAGVPAALAQRVARAHHLAAALDIAEIAEHTGRALTQVAEVHLGLGERLPLTALRQRIDVLPTDTHWQVLAQAAQRDELAALHRYLAQHVVSRHGADARAQLATWQSALGTTLERTQRLLAELIETKQADLAMLSVALRELRNLM